MRPRRFKRPATGGRPAPDGRLDGLDGFDGLDADALERVARFADEVGVPSGFVLVYAGERNDDVFVVADGTAAVIVGGHAERLLGPGNVIGSRPPLTGSASHATVIASTPMRLFVVNRRDVTEVVGRSR